MSVVREWRRRSSLPGSLCRSEMSAGQRGGDIPRNQEAAGLAQPLACRDRTEFVSQRSAGLPFCGRIAAIQQITAEEVYQLRSELSHTQFKDQDRALLKDVEDHDLRRRRRTTGAESATTLTASAAQGEETLELKTSGFHRETGDTTQPVTFASHRQGTSAIALMIQSMRRNTAVES